VAAVVIARVPPTVIMLAFLNHDPLFNHNPNHGPRAWRRQGGDDAGGKSKGHDKQANTDNESFHRASPEDRLPSRRPRLHGTIVDDYIMGHMRGCDHAECCSIGGEDAKEITQRGQAATNKRTIAEARKGGSAEERQEPRC